MSVFREIVSAKIGKRGARLALLRLRVEERYAEFTDPPADLDAINGVTFTAEERRDLLHCYNKETAPLSTLRAAIRARQPQRIRWLCQYCGIDRSLRLDHYMPKANYPEFATHPHNLVPSCTLCNERKGNAFRTNNARRIVHFYFDPVPSQRFLAAHLLYRGADPVAVFRLDLTDVPSRGAQMLQRHFSRLGLLDRYAEAANTVIDNAHSSVVTHSPAAAAEFLLAEARRQERRYSVNYWESVLLRALAADAPFLASCCAP